LIIETNKQLCLENEKLVVNGNIKIRSGGSFILNNATLVIVNEYKGQHRISADESFIEMGVSPSMD